MSYIPDTCDPGLATQYSDAAKRPSVAIVGAGSYARDLAAVAIRKRFPITAAFKRPGRKVGEDFGVAVGLEQEIGVKIEDINSVPPKQPRAQVAVVAAGSTLKENFDTYRLLLEGGYNVLCLAPQAFHPYFFDAETAGEIDAAARSNGVTFTGGGIWDMSRVWAGILTVGPCTEISEITHRSVTDVGRQVRSIEHAIEYKIPIGITVDEFRDQGYDTNSTGLLYPMIATHVLEAVGYSVVDYQVMIEPVVTETPMESWLFEEPIPAGRCIGQRIVCDLATREGVKGRTEVELRLCDPGEEEYMAWSVKGVPSLSVRTVREDSINVTVMSHFNRIPDVITAPPGIVLISQMGPLKHTALVR